MKFLNKKLILASKSPRRKQLLSESGFDFIIKTKDTDESYPAGLSPGEIAEYIADKKAEACRSFLTEHPAKIILAADTIVVLGTKVYGKPEDFRDAVRILNELKGKTHRVITGVCLLSRGKKRLFHGVSKVTFADLTEEEIEYYLNKCEPYDKAGSYGVQEWLGHCKITDISGTYANIMGLPTDLVYEELRRF